MNAVQAIQASAATSDMIVNAYLADLDDADLLKRPHPDCNHLAWQLGHLIASECMLLEAVKPGAAIELPEGFADKHTKETIGSDSAADFYTKQEYLDLYTRARAATQAALEGLSDADLGAANENERFKEMFPTVGHMYMLNASHPLMHAGQWVPVRRALGKDIVI